jgi:hypothetical protein
MNQERKDEDYGFEEIPILNKPFPGVQRRPYQVSTGESGGRARQSSKQGESHAFDKIFYHSRFTYVW